MRDTPAGYWRLGEPSGTTCTDSSGNGRHGTYVGSPGLNLSGIRAGNTAASFADSGNVYAEIPNAVFPYSDAFTVEYWIYLTGYGTTDWRCIVLHGDEGARHFGMWLYDDTNSQLLLDIGGGASMQTTFSLGLNRWHYVCATHAAGGTGSVYLDGVLRQTTVAGGTPPPGTTAPFTIGGHGRGFLGVTGKLDEVAYYTYALSAARVKAHFDAGAPYASAVLTDNPRAYWRLGEASGTTLTDTGVNAYHATAGGGVTLGQPGPLAEVDTAALFDGSSGYASAPQAIGSGLLHFTFEAWIKTTGAGSSRRRIISQQGAEGYWLMALTDNVLELGSSIDGILTTAGPLLNDNRWHHVAVTRASSVIKTNEWYVDGVLVLSASGLAGTYNITSTVEIGRYVGNTEHFNGLIDEVAIYPARLTQARIQAHYAAASNLTRWDGTVWQPTLARRWSGSAWVPFLPRRWSGTAWVPA